jgi:hypothetical protein
VRGNTHSADRVRDATKLLDSECVRESAPAEPTESSSSFKRSKPTADERPDRAESRPLRAEPVRESSGVVVKPLRGQLSKLTGATEEFGVPVPEERGVSRVIGLNVGAPGSILQNACFPLGVKRRGEDALELGSEKGLYRGALNDTTELPEEPVRERPGEDRIAELPEEPVRDRPGEERIEATELERSGSGDDNDSRRQESCDDKEIDESVDERPEGGFLLDGICKRESELKRKVSCVRGPRYTDPQLRAVTNACRAILTLCHLNECLISTDSMTPPQPYDCRKW